MVTLHAEGSIGCQDINPQIATTAVMTADPEPRKPGVSGGATASNNHGPHTQQVATRAPQVTADIRSVAAVIHDAIAGARRGHKHKVTMPLDAQPPAPWCLD